MPKTFCTTPREGPKLSLWGLSIRKILQPQDTWIDVSADDVTHESIATRATIPTDDFVGILSTTPRTVGDECQDDNQNELLPLKYSRDGLRNQDVQSCGNVGPKICNLSLPDTVHDVPQLFIRSYPKPVPPKSDSKSFTFRPASDEVKKQPQIPDCMIRKPTSQAYDLVGFENFRIKKQEVCLKMNPCSLGLASDEHAGSEHYRQSERPKSARILRPQGSNRERFTKTSSDLNRAESPPALAPCSAYTVKSLCLQIPDAKKHVRPCTANCTISSRTHWPSGLRAVQIDEQLRPWESYEDEPITSLIGVGHRNHGGKASNLKPHLQDAGKATENAVPASPMTTQISKKYVSGGSCHDCEDEDSSEIYQPKNEHRPTLGATATLKRKPITHVSSEVPRSHVARPGSALRPWSGRGKPGALDISVGWDDEPSIDEPVSDILTLLPANLKSSTSCKITHATENLGQKRSDKKNESQVARPQSGRHIIQATAGHCCSELKNVIDIDQKGPSMTSQALTQPLILNYISDIFSGHEAGLGTKTDEILQSDAVLQQSLGILELLVETIFATLMAFSKAIYRSLKTQQQNNSMKQAAAEYNKRALQCEIALEESCAEVQKLRLRVDELESAILCLDLESKTAQVMQGWEKNKRLVALNERAVLNSLATAINLQERELERSKMEAGEILKKCENVLNQKMINEHTTLLLCEKESQLHTLEESLKNREAELESSLASLRKEIELSIGGKVMDKTSLMRELRLSIVENQQLKMLLEERELKKDQEKNSTDLLGKIYHANACALSTFPQK